MSFILLIVYFLLCFVVWIAGLMVWYQKFEYAIGHWLQKATEHMIGCVLCSPGCFSLFRGRALMDDNVMAKYTTVSSQARHYVQYDQGTCVSKNLFYIPNTVIFVIFLVYFGLEVSRCNWQLVWAHIQGYKKDRDLWHVYKMLSNPSRFFSVIFITN